MSQTQKPSTISNLQSQSDRDLLDLIDKLRSDGVCRYIDLPRIVVCGDQSSGKSSVLEAISGRSFPVDGGTCTRFPTELILRCHPIKSIRASIEPDLNRDEDDKKRLASFKDRDFDPLDDLSKIIAEAKSLLGFNGNDDDPAIVEDILRISISGPDQPHLTMVDLPGLMANKADDKQEKAIEKIQTLVMKYISQPRAIILAVISAKSDFMLQTVTNYTTAVDRNGERTFGLITKPDAMDIGPVEKSYIRIIKNEAEPRLRLGWHVLRNRSDKERDSTISERDKVESEFFRQGVWPSINTDHLGIAKLRLRLSDSLKEQIIQQLPVVIQDLEKFIKDARLKLDSLGPDRGSLDEQECYLNEVEDRFSQLLKAAVDGNHEDSFFHDESVDNGGDGRLRATILNLQDSFDNTMRTEGHAKKIIDRTEKKSGVPRSIYRDDYSKEVQGILKSHRGRELPGTTNHNAVTALFRKQTQPWAKIINNHMTLVIAASYRAVDNMIRYVADENTANGILKHLDGNKKKLTQQVKSKISEIQWSNLHSHPITTNPSFIRDLWETQRFAHEQSIRLALQMYTKNKTNIIEANVEDIIYAVSNMKEEAEMEYHASLQAIYAMEAYYKIAVDQTIDSVIKLVTERSLIQALPTLFNRTFVRSLSRETIKSIAGEPLLAAAERARLTEQISILESGLMELQLFEKYRRVIPIPAVPEVSAGKEASDADYEDPDISPPTRTMTELLELVNEKLVVPEHEVASSGGPSASKHRSPEQEDAVYSEDEETEDEDGSDRYDDEPIVKPSKFGSWGNDIGQLSSPFKDGKQPDSPWLMKRSPGK